jgi:hypothetical protein
VNGRGACTARGRLGRQPSPTSRERSSTVVSEPVSAITTARAATAGCGTDELTETSLIVLELLLLVTVWVLGLTAVHLVKPPPAPRLEHPEPVDGQFIEHARPLPL